MNTDRHTAYPTGYPTPLARINGIALHTLEEVLSPATLRQRASTELLRQAAQAQGLLAIEDHPSPDGIISQDASEAIERLLDQQLPLSEPDETACQRHYAAHASQWRQGERVHLRHVLWAVTPGVDVRRLRERAEAVLLALRCATTDARDATGDVFAQRAAEYSNCPSAAQGGDLGWLRREDCAPEVAREVFGGPGLGVLPQLVHSRFGLHIIEVLAREPGTLPPYPAVRAAVRLSLQQQAWANALQQYLRTLATQAQCEHLYGDDPDSAAHGTAPPPAAQ